MKFWRYAAPCFLAVSIVLNLPPLPAAADEAGPPRLRDGQHDFDFEAGSWKIHLKQLQHPLTGSTSWVEFDGTSVTRHLWNGRAEIEEFETNGAAGSSFPQKMVRPFSGVKRSPSQVSASRSPLIAELTRLGVRRAMRPNCNAINVAAMCASRSG